MVCGRRTGKLPRSSIALGGSECPPMLNASKRQHMTWRHTLFCLLALVSAVAAPGAQSQRVRSDQEILIQLEQDWDAAFHRKDVGFIENVLADEFMATYGDGSRGD